MTIRQHSSLLPRALAIIALGASVCSTQAQTASPPGAATAASPNQIDAAFKRADGNQDGRLTKEEVARMPALADKFDQLDKDKDGHLSPDEFKAGFEAGS